MLQACPNYTPIQTHPAALLLPSPNESIIVVSHKSRRNIETTRMSRQLTSSMTEQLSVILKDSETPVLLNDEAVNYFKFVKEMSTLDNTLSKEPIKLSLSKAVFDKILQFASINNFQPLKVATVKTNDLKQALEGDEKNYNFISKYEGSKDPQLAQLFKGAEYIQCDSLMTLIAVVVACEFYFGDTREDYENIKKRNGVTEEMTFEEDEEYSRNYVYMNQ